MVPLNRFQRKTSIMYWNGICGILDNAVRSNRMRSYLLIGASLFRASCSFWVAPAFDWRWFRWICATDTLTVFGAERDFFEFEIFTGDEYTVCNSDGLSFAESPAKRCLSERSCSRFKCGGAIMAMNIASPMLSWIAALPSWRMNNLNILLNYLPDLRCVPDKSSVDPQMPYNIVGDPFREQ